MKPQRPTAWPDCFRVARPHFFVQRDIGRLASTATRSITLLVTLLYVGRRFGTTNGRCIAYSKIAALLQLAVLSTIKSHSVGRLPMLQKQYPVLR